MAKMPISKPSPDRFGSARTIISEGGFTLIEMLVVLAIMSLAAVLFVSGTGRSSIDQRAEIQKLEQAISGTRAQALQSSTVQTLDLQDFDAELEPALGEKTTNLIFHRDGSTNGGIVSSHGKRRFTVRWIDGKIEK